MLKHYLCSGRSWSGPAVRLLVLTFAFVSDFSRVITKWLEILGHFDLPSRAVVGDALVEAIDLEVMDTFIPDQASAEVEDLLLLINRSMIFALVCVAVFEILI